MENGEISPLTHADEELDISPTIIQKVIVEFMGTFILLFTGCGSGFIDHRRNITILGIAFVWSLTIMAMIYTLGHNSGAHFNPAVTAAFVLTRQFPGKQWVQFFEAYVSVAAPCNWPTDNFTAVAWEIMASVILMWVICGTASDHRVIKELSGAAIFLDVLITGKITGAPMNPARSIGPAIVAKHFRKIWIYIIAPLIGTIASASLYNLLPSPNKLQKNTVKKVTSKIKSTLNPAYHTGKEMEFP